jgi:Uncharacterized protein conserved in bacteria (DUF2252)
MMADVDDPLFLQVKEAGTSVLEPYAGKSIYANHGQRVITGQRPRSTTFWPAEYFRRRAVATESNLIIFSDDPDATEKLVDKI